MLPNPPATLLTPWASLVALASPVALAVCSCQGASESDVLAGKPCDPGYVCGAGLVCHRERGACVREEEVSRYVREVWQDSPAGYWRLGERDFTRVLDSSGFGHHGEFFDSPTVGVDGAIQGDPDTAMEFRGSQRVCFGDTLDLPGTYSLEAWVRPKEPFAHPWWAMVINKYDNHHESAVNWVGYRLGRCANPIPQPPSPTAGDWCFEADGKPEELGPAGGDMYAHLVVTYDATTLRGYLNGALVGSSTEPWVASDTSVPLCIGYQAVPEYSCCPALATVDEVAIYPAALLASRVLAHYNAGVGRSP